MHRMERDGFAPAEMTEEQPPLEETDLAIPQNLNQPQKIAIDEGIGDNGGQPWNKSAPNAGNPSETATE